MPYPENLTLTVRPFVTAAAARVPMDSGFCKRISLKPKKCPNPLFHRWLTEWKNEAKDKGSDMRYVYSKALTSLSKYPLELKSGRECGILKNFGVKICAMLDKKLTEHEQLSKDALFSHDAICDVRDVLPAKKPKLTNPKKKIRPNEATVDELTTLYPGEYRIVLIVDSGETNGLKGKNRSAGVSHVTLSELTSASVPFEVRKLSVGDFAWACVGTSIGSKMDDGILVLPYIVERKRIDDLGSSVRDGRFHEQKFRLKQSGMWQIIYLIEGISGKLGVTEKESARGLPISTLQQASANTEVVDRFIVKDTSGQKETAQYLSMMTKTLSALFQGKTLKQCGREQLPEFTLSSETIKLVSLAEFNRSSFKCKDLTVSQMFVRHLLQIKGLSVEKAVAIIERFPTPADLLKAFEDDFQNSQLLLSSILFGPNKRIIGPKISKVVCDLYTNEVIT